MTTVLILNKINEKKMTVLIMNRPIDETIFTVLNLIRSTKRKKKIDNDFIILISKKKRLMPVLILNR